MNLFTPPESSYTNYFEKARFELTWKLNAFMAVVNLVLITTMYFISLEEFLAALYGWLVPVIYLIILYKTRKYKVLAYVYVFMGVFSTGLAMNLIAVKFHLIEVVFMIMISLYAYFTLGKKIGHISVFIQAVFVLIFILFNVNAEIQQTVPLTKIEIISSCFNFAVAFVLIAYLVQQFITLNTLAEDRYIVANKNLEQTNKIIESRDAEKTVMLREIHHRVKNNLQVIISLLRLQSHETTTPQSAALFDESIRRVMAMSLIHEKMYQTEDLAALDLEEYLKSLLADLISSYSTKTKIELEVESQPIDISDKNFVPLALLCNELISNSLKHAFESLEKGKIHVSFSRLGSAKLKFTYSDNGNWIENLKKDTFGIELIETLSEQLGSEIKRNVDAKGTTYELEIDNLT